MSTSPSAPLELTYRPGMLDDWPGIASILAETEDDGRTIDETIWRSWTIDPTGQLITALQDEQIVGFARLVELGPAEWWLEWLRIELQPRHEAIGQALMGHVIGLFKGNAIGLLRFFASSKNEIIPNLVEKFGFVHTLSYTPMHITAQPTDYRSFKSLQPANLELAYAYLRRSPIYRVNHFAEYRWTAYYLTKERLGAYLADPAIEVLGWRQFDQLHGLAILMPDSPENPGDSLELAYLDAGDDTSLGAMLTAIRGIAAKKEREKVAWKVPVGIGLDRLLLTIELERSWDGDLWLYELPLQH